MADGKLIYLSLGSNLGDRAANLERAIEALQGRSAPKKPAAVETNVAALGAPKKRHVSAAARKKMAAAQKKRWAAIKGAKQA